MLKISYASTTMWLQQNQNVARVGGWLRVGFAGVTGVWLGPKLEWNTMKSLEWQGETEVTEFAWKAAGEVWRAKGAQGVWVVASRGSGAGITEEENTWRKVLAWSRIEREGGLFPRSIK